MCKDMFGPSIALILVISLAVAQAQESVEIAGRWRCDRICRIWDTGASITIEGKQAVCTNELGDASEGQLLTNRSVRCFGLVGQLTDDNESIQWSNGNIWRRDHRTSF
jgi:hypothetical protein